MRTALTLLVLLVGTMPATAASPKLRKPARGFQMRTTPVVVRPGEDKEWCEYRRLPNRKAMDAQGFQLKMPTGAHHFVLWAYNGNVTDDSRFPQAPVEVVGCAGLGPGDSLVPVNLFGMQTPTGRVRFPKGIAVRLQPHQQVWLNPHMKNFAAEDLESVVVFNITPARRGSVKHHAESFVVGNIPGIDIPAGGNQTLVSEWAAPADLNIIQFSSHQHRLGTYVGAELEQSDGTFAPLYDNANNWEHPYELWTHREKPWKDQNPQVIRLTKGQRVRFTCKWHNPESTPVHFGPETTDEMCFVTGYFYRDDESAPPIRGPRCAPLEEGILCPLATTLASSHD